MLPVVDQPASYPMAQDCTFSPAIEAQSQHVPRPDDADAAVRVIHQAASSAAAGASNWLPGVISAQILVGSLSPGDYSHAHPPGAMPPRAAHPRSVVTDACKVQSTSPEPQPLPTATDKPFTDQWAARTNWPASTPSEASATTETQAEPPVAAAQAMECPTGEGSATRLARRGWRPTDKTEPLPPQPSSIFGSPEASASEEHGQAAGSADLDGTVAASEVQPAESHFGQTMVHQHRTTDPPFSAAEAADAESRLVAPPSHLQGPTSQLDSTYASNTDRTPSSTDAASAIDHGTTVSGAQANNPPSGWSSSSLLPASSDIDHEVAAPIASGTRGVLVICPPPDASVAEMVLPELLASDVVEVISSQGAPCETSWLPASTPQRQESSSGR